MTNITPPTTAPTSTTTGSSEPILWVTSNAQDDSRRSQIVWVDGEPVKHRFPQRGYQGGYDDLQPTPGTRFLYMVRHEGHTVAHTLTCAAAHLDPNTDYGQQQMALARHHGWYQPGQCPVAMLLTGDLQPHLVVDKSIIADTACPAGSYSYASPCKHSLSEKAARTERHTKKYLAIELAHKTDQARQNENTAASLDEQRKTSALMAQLLANQTQQAKPAK